MRIAIPRKTSPDPSQPDFVPRPVEHQYLQPWTDEERRRLGLNTPPPRPAAPCIPLSPPPPAPPAPPPRPAKTLKVVKPKSAGLNP
jgi:hypothetical protein